MILLKSRRFPTFKLATFIDNAIKDLKELYDVNRIPRNVTLNKIENRIFSYPR